VSQAIDRLTDLVKPPLRRENRLYQADWLMRLYGFSIDEVVSSASPWLDLTIDPKQAFAQRHPELFPVDINTADREMILKVPGIGLKSANRIVNLRRKGGIRLDHLRQLGAIVSRARPFIHCDGLPEAQWSGATLKQKPQVPESLSVAGGKGKSAVQAGQRIFETDGTFEGLLTAIYEAYAQGNPPDAIVPKSRGQRGLFEQPVAITTSPALADRVWKGLKTHLGVKGRRRLYDAFLSGHTGVETMIFQLVSDTIATRSGRGTCPQLSAVIQIDQLSSKVRREAHRMKGFIRFQQTADDRYLALIAPRYDVLPLVRRHFESRFADQAWMIVDTQRNYGLCYAQGHTRELQVDPAEFKDTWQGENADEHLCQTLWQRYYTAVNVQPRNNPRLHVNKLPRRYWRYLTEKQT
jgi:probable DNA metabolism protein